MISEMGIKVVIILAAIVVGVASRYIPGYKDDNVVEEASEQVVKEESGFDLDFTPGSPEKR